MKLQNKLSFRNMNKYKLNSAFTRIFIGYICIMTLFFMFTSGMYYYIKGVMIQKEIYKNEDYLNLVSTIVDNEFSYLKESMYRLLQSYETSNKPQSNNDVGNLYDLNKGLVRLKYNQKFIAKCYLYNKDSELIVGDEEYIYKKDLFNSTCKYINMDREEIFNIIDSAEKFMYIPTSKVYIDYPVKETSTNGLGTKDIISFIMGMSYSSSKNKLVLLIDEDNVRTTISDTNIVGYGTVFIIDGKGRIISSSERDKISNQLDKNILDAIMKKGNSSGSVILNRNLIAFEKSKFTDWYYVTLVPDKNIVKNIIIARNIFIYGSSILLLLGILLAFVFSKLNYKPIDGLVKKLRNNNECDGNYKDEFALIDGVLEKIQVKSKEYEVNNKLLDMLTIGSNSNQWNGVFKHDNFQVIIIKNCLSSKIVELIQSFIENNPKQDMDFKIVKLSEQECYIIINSDCIFEEDIIEYISFLKEQLEMDDNVFLIAGMGNICSSVEELKISLDNALLAIRQGDSGNEKCIYQYNKGLGENYSIYFPINFENLIIECLQTENNEYIENLIEDIFNKNSGLPNLYMRSIVIEFANVYVRIANQFEYKYDEISLSKNIENEYRLKIIKDFIKNIYKQLVIPRGFQVDRAAQVESFIVSYVNENYFDQNITIEGIAEKLNLSPTYVSTLFKKATGTAFSQYIVEYRINKAKDLLKNTDLKVKDISEKVGFGTYNNFARVFRKETGVSPGDFRNNNI